VALEEELKYDKFAETLKEIEDRTNVRGSSTDCRFKHVRMIAGLNMCEYSPSIFNRVLAGYLR
jgi:hypothetical protein